MSKSQHFPAVGGGGLYIDSHISMLVCYRIDYQSYSVIVYHYNSLCSSSTHYVSLVLPASGLDVYHRLAS